MILNDFLHFKDSIDDLILKLKRELRKLENENKILKQKAAPITQSATQSIKLFQNNLSRSDSQLYGKLKEFMNENRHLR